MRRQRILRRSGRQSTGHETFMIGVPWQTLEAIPEGMEFEVTADRRGTACLFRFHRSAWQWPAAVVACTRKGVTPHETHAFGLAEGSLYCIEDEMCDDCGEDIGRGRMACRVD